MDRRTCLALVGTVASGGGVGCLSGGGESTPAGTASGPRSEIAAATGTVTATPLPHMDLAYETAQYYLTDRFLFRNRTVAECWG
ncbi:hypothetical protein ACFQMA_05040 [Halosimplex aquaticum]|uniref:Uncharacterized protein n=1 Tax=Halosimplex aquaticum TaxID=3026162 RepID=A0ABD5Y169_9EURY|nr:hypothetical protein [Halosimplex aquaticum]